jgi:hypothetical protein
VLSWAACGCARDCNTRGGACQRPTLWCQRGIARASPRTTCAARSQEGAEPVGNTPEEFAEFIRAEKQRLGAVIARGRISLE